MMFTGKQLLEDGQIQCWQSSLMNRYTARNYLRALASFCSQIGEDPHNLLKLSEEDITSIVKKWVDENSCCPKSKALYKAVLKNWLLFNGRSLGPISIRGQNLTPTIIEERPPTPNELRSILLRAPLRAKTIIVLIAFAGLRYTTISKINLKDIVDLDVNTLTVKNIPMLIHVPPEKHKIGSRSGHGYFTFLIQEGAEILVEYLKTRTNLQHESPVISSLDADRSLHPHRVRSIVRPYIPPILNARPYVLRSYFDYALLGARVHEKWQHFFMGHAGDIEATYTTKKHLHEHLIQPMRETFKPAEQLLTTQPKPNLDTEKIDIVKKIAQLFLGPQELEITLKPRDS